MRIYINLASEDKGKPVSTSIDSDVLSHIFVSHSLALHKWAKESREKLQTEINTMTMASQRDNCLYKVHHYFDDLESCERRRTQADAVEEVFKHLTQDK